MNRISATSVKAMEAAQMLSEMQLHFVNILESINRNAGYTGKFKSIEWYRNAGKFGGGNRYIAPENEFFNGGGVNFSQIQYEKVSDKSLRSATALSIIVHPKNPKAPSFHMHVSYTEMKEGESYWRIMADLNPAISNPKDKSLFISSLKEAAGEYYEEGSEQGDRYFFIPLLERHRGVCHFYLEKFLDDTIAVPFITIIQNCYGKILNNYTNKNDATKEDRQLQLDYHTLYFYQVLTLDRGTTSGLLVHDENDTGILASLPSHINKDLLLTWRDKMEHPQKELLDNLLSVLPKGKTCLITNDVKTELAKQIRAHYKKYPSAVQLQASGNIIPPTVKNHQ
ncbi:MAG: coproporphyrinogen III oxidase [Crocinitomicaceae bacterium]|nr:coproporphyrinogen III oxidase [Crocinitomicaceae bacterium]